MNETCTLTQRRSIIHGQDQENLLLEPHEPNDEPNELTLMEQILLLYLNQDGVIPLVDDCLSPGLRACILVELELHGRIALEKATPKCRRMLDLKILIKNDENVGDVLLDEALSHIRTTQPPESIEHWISYLTGTVWNPLKLKYQLKCARERVAKGLVEKGILVAEKKSYLWFETMTYPMVNVGAKREVVVKIREALLGKWQGDAARMDRRTLALIILGEICDVLDKTLRGVRFDDHDKVMERLEVVFDHVNKQSRMKNASLVLYAVYPFFTN